MSKSLIDKPPQFSLIKRQIGEDALLDFIRLTIVDLNDFLSIGKKMSGQQIDSTAKLILQEFWQLNPADLNIVFKLIKTGGYGSLFDSFDGLKLMQWLREYRDAKLKLAFENNYAKSVSLKGSLSRPYKVFDDEDYSKFKAGYEKERILKHGLDVEKGSPSRYKTGASSGNYKKRILKQKLNAKKKRRSAKHRTGAESGKRVHGKSGQNKPRARQN